MFFGRTHLLAEEVLVAAQLMMQVRMTRCQGWAKHPFWDTHLEWFVKNGRNLSAIPIDIPLSVTDIDLSENIIKLIPSNSFMNFNLCTSLKLDHNQIVQLENDSFRGLVNLNTLNLTNNRVSNIWPELWLPLRFLRTLALTNNSIFHLPSRVFRHLKNLQFLHLQKNWINEIGNDVWYGLKNLQNLLLSQNKIAKISENALGPLDLQDLDLSGNKISHLFMESLCTLKISHLNNNSELKFKSFTCLNSYRRLQLSNNKLSEIQKGLFYNIWRTIDLNNNNITHIEPGAFVNLKRLQKLFISMNQLTVLQYGTFSNISRLEILDLSHNKIYKLETGIFNDFETLKELHLNHNMLKHIDSRFFHGYKNFEINYFAQWKIKINLADNIIERINKGALYHINAASMFSIVIDLTGNKLSHLTWTIFFNDTDEYLEYSCSKSVLYENKFEIDLCRNDISCTDGLCTIEKLKNQPDECGKNLKIEQDKCHGDWKTCPQEDKCTTNDLTKCISHCKSKKCPSGKLFVNPNICLLGYFCSCEPCPPLNKPACEMNCTAIGRQPSKENTYDKFGCELCKCECLDTMCSSVCNSNSFRIVNNAYGCPVCSCCPEVDCDVCEGGGLNIVRNDSNGCPVCGDCNYTDNRGGNKSTMAGILAAVSLIGLFAIIAFGITFYWRSVTIEVSVADNVTENVLDLLVCNLDPDAAHEVRDSWVKPSKFTAGNLLGTGKFAVTLSGSWQLGPSSEKQIAVKKVRAEFTDRWYVENWNKENELKRHVKKIRVQQQLYNKVVENFLTEAIIMKKLCHTNILTMFGISVHEEKPCMLLPLMSNGDLKSYLSNKSHNVTVRDQLGFALGVAKGMEYLAEQKIVHRDLAARNCLLDGNMHIKLSDFGLAKKVFVEGNYAVEEHSEAVPIRWMSIEAIEYSVFTTYSDVWSYGVLLWEIFTFGGHPYDGLGNIDILQFLKEGNRLEKPPQASDYLYEIMADCWKETPEERPSFSNILTALNQIADHEGGYMELQQEQTR